MTSIHVSKLDAVKRELEHAIRLFFLSGDPVVIHLVISSAQQVLRDLCRYKKIPSFINQAMSMVKKDKQAYVMKELRKSYNFFHHGDKDPDGTVEFNPDSNDYALWECVDMYSSLTKETTGLMQAYRLWFYTKNSNLLLEMKDQKLFEGIAQTVDITKKRLFLDVAEELENRRAK